ncbi:MAG: GspH/FimT family pseudopilin [Marinobacter sp.]|uniref:GspH/FimT family pseudopilin n=1 Tax=Marinobacter sp. TaxID=50741 RepID=UPI003F9724FA
MFKTHENSGFTLIELMVTVAILAITVMIAVPSFQGVIASNQLQEARDSLRTAIQYAKGEAVARNRVVSLCPSADGSTCGDDSNWVDGWIVVSDNNQTGAVSVNTLLRAIDGPETSAVTLTGGGSLDYFRFLPDGLADVPAGAPATSAFGICDPDGDVSPYSLLLTTRTGSISTGTEAQANCP